MILDNDEKIIKELDPNSLLTEDKIKLLGWCPGFNIPGYRRSYFYKHATLVESFKTDTFGEEIFNGYSFHYKGWVTHCWTVAELVETTKKLG